MVLDAENSVEDALALAEETLANVGVPGAAVHGVLSGTPRAGVFVTPDGASHGAIETLCRRAVKDERLAGCVDALVACAGSPHADRINSRVAEDKGWLRAYLGMLAEPDLRFHQAFAHPQGIDVMHPAFAPLRGFLLAL